MSAFTEPLAQVRGALSFIQYRMEDETDNDWYAHALAAIAQVERLATDMETALREIIDLPVNQDPVHIARAALTGEET